MIVKEITSALKFTSLVGTFSVVLIYVPRTERDLQKVCGGIYGGIHIQVYSIIGSRENILLVMDSM